LSDEKVVKLVTKETDPMKQEQVEEVLSLIREELESDGSFIGVVVREDGLHLLSNLAGPMALTLLEMGKQVVLSEFIAGDDTLH